MTPGIVAESDLSGVLKSEYVFFEGERVARRDNPTGTSPTVAYYFSDHLKTASVITDSQGNIKSESDYYPWGGELQFVANDSNHYKFTGKERDETGLDYFCARYYSNGMGRFITPDWDGKAAAVPYAEFADPQSLNLYSYVRNVPTSKVDADGHDPWSLSWQWHASSSFLGQEIKGVGDVTIKPIATSLAHPINTVVGLGTTILHPLNSAIAIKDAVVSTAKSALAGDPRAIGQAVGTVAAAAAGAAEGGAGAGGRLGSSATRSQNAAIADSLESRGFTVTGGGGRLPEEYIPGPGGGTKGSNYVDVTATRDGSTVRVQTVDTRADGVTPTTREANNAARIRSQQQPGDHTVLIPKKKTN